MLQSPENPNKFIFYEVYKSVDEIAHHKEQAHYNLWAEFKASGGVVSSVTHKLDGISMTD